MSRIWILRIQIDTIDREFIELKYSTQPVVGRSEAWFKEFLWMTPYLYNTEAFAEAFLKVTSLALVA